MSASYEAEWRARFGDDSDLPQDVPEIAWLRQVLMRRTHRRYAERPVPEVVDDLVLVRVHGAGLNSADLMQVAGFYPAPPGSPERAALEARQPTGRLVSADDVAHAIAYLASPSSGSTTGTALPVDGGMQGLRVRH